MPINEASLLSSTSAWLCRDDGTHCTPEDTPTPVLFVALHACGSLTPDILRAFIAAAKSADNGPPASSHWAPRGAVVVGCCYNMMKPEGECRAAFSRGTRS